MTRRYGSARITGPQESYLRRLLDEAFAHLYAHGLCIDRNRLDGLTKAEASACIDALKRAKDGGWARLNTINGP